MPVKRAITGHKLNARCSWGHKRPAYKGKWAAAIPSIVDLRPQDNPILDQGQEGDCTAAASNGVWMFLRQQISPAPLTSLDFFYGMELIRDGDFGQDNGSMGSTAAFVLTNIGVCLDLDLAPNNGQGYCTQPSQAAIKSAFQNRVPTFSIAGLGALKQNLAAGFPAFFGIPVYPSWVNSQDVMNTGIIPMPGSSEQVAGGHEIKTVGYDDHNEWLIIANSWGTSEGAAGYFFLPYNYFSEYSDATYTARL